MIGLWSLSKSRCSGWSPDESLYMVCFFILRNIPDFCDFFGYLFAVTEKRKKSRVFANIDQVLTNHQCESRELFYRVAQLFADLTLGLPRNPPFSGDSATICTLLSWPVIAPHSPRRMVWYPWPISWHKRTQGAANAITGRFSFCSHWNIKESLWLNWA